MQRLPPRKRIRWIDARKVDARGGEPHGRGLSWHNPRAGDALIRQGQDPGTASRAEDRRGLPGKGPADGAKMRAPLQKQHLDAAALRHLLDPPKQPIYSSPSGG
ncbi:hypothetical protein CC78DRAFT_580725 [Lojkania enalia]|uniref:Uncharacterized protein n=1 Tax=Lojkania enalia TaxID=147567 RepID=A0A9P4K7G9_9PLEO|nr:hypothetical protein CC78DRAFT_580725 [Didymosphaeria enalia]